MKNWPMQNGSINVCETHAVNCSDCTIVHLYTVVYCDATHSNYFTNEYYSTYGFAANDIFVVLAYVELECC